MSGRSRRLFFALWPDDETRHALFHWQTHNLPAAVRWMHRADLHMTLHFLGQVEEERLELLRDLGATVEKWTFELVLDQIGHWPRPQVVWAGTSAVPDELLALHARLGEGLRTLDFRTEERTFHPHVTLARKVRRLAEPGALAALCWPVTELVLVESCHGDAPNYQPIARWPMAAAADRPGD